MRPRRWAIAGMMLTGMMVALAPGVMADSELGDRGEMGRGPGPLLLLSQRVVDGLPPPPPSPTPPPQAPTVSVPTTPRPPGAPAPVPMPGQTPTGNRYVVVINGDSPLLLDQVRRVESEAAIQTFQGQQVIQAGVFDNATVAQRRAETLASQGIGAEIVAVPMAALPQVAAAPAPASPGGSATPGRSPVAEPELLPLAVVPREVEFGQPPAVDLIAQAENAPIRGSSYFVVIPGRSGDIEAIANQVIRLGSGIGIASVVDERTSPLGPHVLVGPYNGRSAASRWSRFFRDFGMDARVYYRR
jgi:hypothetical protein